MRGRTLICITLAALSLGSWPGAARAQGSEGIANQPPPEQQGEHLFREDNAHRRLLYLGAFAVVVLIGGAFTYRWLTSPNDESES